jgi:hypothetical protein
VQRSPEVIVLADEAAGAAMKARPGGLPSCREKRPHPVVDPDVSRPGRAS